MAFMELEITRKGVYISADCAKCGETMTTHEWVNECFNDDREALQDGTARCNWCGGLNDVETYREQKNVYAGRYSAPGYLDCTEWSYDTNKRRLEKELRAMYDN